MKLNNIKNFSYVDVKNGDKVIIDSIETPSGVIKVNRLGIVSSEWNPPIKDFMTVKLNEPFEGKKTIKVNYMTDSYTKV